MTIRLSRRTKIACVTLCAVAALILYNAVKLKAEVTYTRDDVTAALNSLEEQANANNVLPEYGLTATVDKNRYIVYRSIDGDGGKLIANVTYCNKNYVCYVDIPGFYVNGIQNILVDRATRIENKDWNYFYNPNDYPDVPVTGDTNEMEGEDSTTQPTEGMDDYVIERGEEGGN